MKLCLYLQRRFAPIGHEIARTLKHTYGVEEFCAYVELRSSFDYLCAQKDVPYTKLILEEEIIRGATDEDLDIAYLESLERKYGVPNLWPFINHDRVIRYNLLVHSYPTDRSSYTRDDMLKILQRVARSLEKFLDEEKPDAIFFSAVTGMGSYLLYEMAKKRGITLLCLYNPRFGERYALTDDYFHYASLDEATRKMHSKEKANESLRAQAAKYLHEFQNNPVYYLEASGGATGFTRTPTGRAAHFRFLASPASVVRSIKWLFRSFYIYFANPHRSDYTTIQPLSELLDKITRRLRVLRGYRDLYTTPDPRAPFAYFPLHHEPEALPMLLAPNYAFEQIWTIKQIARALPVSYTLYVKDHPVMVGRRPRTYYTELLKIPNVKLVDPAASSLGLIESSKIVFTISGTAGMEAALLKKPAVVFSDVFYGRLPNVVRCDSVEKLPQEIASALAEDHYDEEATIDFIAAIFKESVFVDLTKLWTVQGSHMSIEEKRELEPLADLIAHRLQLRHVSQ